MVLHEDDMKEKYELTVIISNYNQEKYIRQCIESILCQSIDGLEVIIVDDGSEEFVKKFFEKLKFQNLKYIYKDNSGVSETRNIGINNVNTEYVVFCDSFCQAGL